MADRFDKVTKNAPGKYYVDTHCTLCEVCIDLVPDVFAAYDLGNYAYVQRQPESAEEERLCREALQKCPENAIGDDGN